MTSLLEQATVEGFWGSHRIHIPFNDDINFLIGINGSGKTTLIKLISSALTGNFIELDEIEFESITLKLRRASPYSKPIVIVSKEEDDDGNEDIVYRIRNKASDDPEMFSWNQSLPVRYRRDPRIISRMKTRTWPNDGRLENYLAEICNVSWISVHRGSLIVEESSRQEDSVDKKLRSITTLVSEYFRSLQARSSEEVDRFQKAIILSLIQKESDDSLVRKVADLDLEAEQESLREAFVELGVEEKRFGPRIRSHFKRTEKSLNQLKDKEHIFLEDIFMIVNTWTIHHVVAEWHALSEKKEEIFKRRELFLEIVNRFLQRKTLNVGETAKLYARTQSGKLLDPVNLSSGEKQLLILLGEALMQKDETCIYIADEPELSLHIEWQDKLVASLTQLNPNMQILFATHSPDIVGAFQEKVIDMEKVIL